MRGDPRDGESHPVALRTSVGAALWIWEACAPGGLYSCPCPGDQMDQGAQRAC